MGTTPRFAHVVLQTSRLPEMRDWYCTLLDGHVVFEGHGLSFVTFDEEHHRIAFMSPPVALDAKSPQAAGMHHVAYTFDSLDQLLDRYTELADKGIEPHVPIQHGVTTSLYYRDPDGNFVELQVDNFATPEQATAYMAGPEYEQDPVGPSFRPELMREARHAGTTAEELTTRTWALTTSPDLPNPLVALTS
ncbi:MAG: biphenyl 2,3-dioxygenase [Pseudonocardiaceae bacterium]|nr:biphenyl 2,3-dioxygenase [Pseudonocardiaceae bacterium]